MILWLVIITGYSLIAVRLIWAIMATRRTTAISLARLSGQIMKASELMLDQQVIAVQANRPKVGFQLRKTISSDNDILLEAIIPYVGCEQYVELLVESYAGDYTIVNCKSLKSADGAIVFYVGTEQHLTYFLNFFQALFSVPQMSKYAISKAYLLDARHSLRIKIRKFADKCFFSKAENICKMMVPTEADLFQSDRPPQIHVNEIYLLLAKDENAGAPYA